jgi:hypothetical protein
MALCWGNEGESWEGGDKTIVFQTRAIFESGLLPCEFPNNLNPGYSSYIPAYEGGTGCSETLVYKLQTPVNNPEETCNIQNKAKV